MTLDDLLSRAYAAMVLNREPIAKVLDAFKADPTLLAPATARLAEIDNEDLCTRCFITKTQRDFLRQALA